MEKSFLENAKILTDFISSSPSPYHVVANMRKGFENANFIELEEKRRFLLEKGKSYFVTRNGSAVIAFKIPEKPLKRIHIISAHTDSPSFKIKPDPEVVSSSCYTTLNVEGYGGMLMAPWFDRPLSIAGRVFVDTADGVECRLVNFDEDLVSIVNLAIHQNRKANEGICYKVQKELLPIFADKAEKGSFISLLSKHLDVEKKDILDYDLFLYSRTPSSFWGLDKAFFSIGKIDDLECAHSAYRALIETPCSESTMIAVALFDNEEVGSGSKQGALSDFLKTTLDRVFASLKIDEEEKAMLEASSFMLSADNGHALHPNYPEVSDIVNKPVVNGGVLIKYSANQKYTTDAESGAFVKKLMKDNNIPYQVFVNNSDVVGGSTLGNLSTQKISIRTADVGLAQLAMHSPYETAGVKDVSYLLSLFKAFFSL